MHVGHWTLIFEKPPILKRKPLSSLLNNNWLQTGWRMCLDYWKLNVASQKAKMKSVHDKSILHKSFNIFKFNRHRLKPKLEKRSVEGMYLRGPPPIE